MKKWQILLGAAACVLLLLGVSCRRDNGVHQQIDQIIHFYVQDVNGKDLIVPVSQDSMSYTDRINFYDNLSLTINAPVPEITKGVDNNQKNYIQYVAGAVRKDSTSTTNPKLYTSQFVINYNKKTGDTKTMAPDRIDIVYSSTPSMFKVSTISLNKKVVFDSSSGLAKDVIIVKQ